MPSAWQYGLNVILKDFPGFCYSRKLRPRARVDNRVAQCIVKGIGGDGGVVELAFVAPFCIKAMWTRWGMWLLVKRLVGVAIIT
jgi:hypothetical protein